MLRNRFVPNSGLNGVEFIVAGPNATFDPTFVGTNSQPVIWVIRSPSGTDNRIVAGNAISENLALAETYTVTALFAGNESTLMTSLDANSENLLEVNNLPILTNLQTLLLNFNSLTDMSSIQNMTSLTNLQMGSNSLTAFDPSALTNLTILSLFTNNISVLNVGTLVNINSLFCQINPLIATLNTAPLVNMTDIRCTNTALSTLDVSTMPNLIICECAQTTVASLSLSGKASLQRVIAYSTNIGPLLFPNPAIMNEMRLDGSNMNIGDVDAMLISLDNASVPFGGLTYRYDGQPGGAHLDVNRSAAANTAITNLGTKGWTRNGTY